jgi:uncharacterized heparinase superfamily protein
MYHALALEDILDLKNMLLSAGLPVPTAWDEKIAAMRRWLATMCHPDGEIAFFNDAAFGVAPPPGELERYATSLGLAPSAPVEPGCTWLRDSGYIRLQNDRAVVLIDVARIGPDYLPGHAHADTLSFELSVDGRRIIVNSGTSTYGVGPERARQRGTAAHNTVVVDRQNSSEVWSGFRAARRARPFNLTVNTDAISCSHDGYMRLKDGPAHCRAWHLEADRLAVEDNLTRPHVGEARYHFEPTLNPSTIGDGAVSGAASLDGTLFSWCVESDSAHMEKAIWAPEFNLNIPTYALVIQLSGYHSKVTFIWSDLYKSGDLI